MKTLLALLLMTLGACAQNVAVLTHGAANSEEFRNGCPTNWPASIIDIGASTNLPASCSATNGWVTMKASDLEATKSALSVLKEAFNKKWIALNGPGVTYTTYEFTKRVEAKSPGAWDRLDDAIVNPAIPPEVRSQLRQARRLMNAAQEVNTKDADTIAFFNAAVLVGILSEEQKTAILTPE